MISGLVSVLRQDAIYIICATKIHTNFLTRKIAIYTLKFPEASIKHERT